MAEIIVLAEVRKAREIARRTDALAQYDALFEAWLELISAWLKLSAAMMRLRRSRYVIVIGEN